MGDKAVYACLLQLRCVADWLATNKILENRDNVLLPNDDIDLDDIDSDTGTFCSVGTGLNTIDLNNINLGNEKFDEDDPETVIHIRLMAWCNRYKQRKACKKDISN